MASEKPVDPEVADLQKRLALCEAEKERRKLENRGLRGILRRALGALLSGRVRRDDFPDSSGFNSVPPLDQKDQPK